MHYSITLLLAKRGGKIIWTNLFGLPPVVQNYSGRDFISGSNLPSIQGVQELCHLWAFGTLWMPPPPHYCLRRRAQHRLAGGRAGQQGQRVAPAHLVQAEEHRHPDPLLQQRDGQPAEQGPGAGQAAAARPWAPPTPTAGAGVRLVSVLTSKVLSRTATWALSVECELHRVPPEPPLVRAQNQGEWLTGLNPRRRFVLVLDRIGPNPPTCFSLKTHSCTPPRPRHHPKLAENPLEIL